MSHRRIVATLALVVFSLVCFTGVAFAVASPTNDTPPTPAQSPYLIVELQSPPLAAVYKTQLQSAVAANGRLDANSAAAQSYMAQLEAEQAAFVSQMQAVLPNATVGQYYADDQLRMLKPLSYRVVFNGMAVNPGTSDPEAARRLLSQIPGVKAVYQDAPHYTDLYTSTTLINAPVVWDVLGGRENAGWGVKFASMDGGVHKDAPMFSNADGKFQYPNGFGPFGKGLINNNNGKIIVSRAYFRSWDPPQTADPGKNGCGDACAWPGPAGTSHGVHTASTAAGRVITDAMYSGLNVGTISGVAPGAWVMSYKVFYGSVRGDGSFYNAEGIAALEDIAMDGADVLNNSWGSGPSSNGNLGDPLETALANAAASGVFISMSAGNAGPSASTLDHPLSDYINVAASSTGGTLASGKVSIPGREDLQDIPFTTASFGEPLPPGQVMTYTVLPGEVVDPSNALGCNPWPAGTFNGKAALILRGSCEFGVKVLNAEQAGAVFVIVYNHAAGGEGLINMGPGAVGDQVTISSIFIGHTAGVAIVEDYNNDPTSASLVVNTIAFQVGNTPDRITSFSSRGPTVGLGLKPDIAAPGENILAQGYTPGAEGEEQYFGYGQASGTSMAAPHVAGAAVLVRQAYPNWTNAQIKSALMTTSKYTDVYNFDGTPAQPLDMGAGRLDLARVLDPGVLVDPVNVSFGAVHTGTAQSLVVTVMSVATQTETYQLSTLYTGDGFTMTTALAGFSVEPASITLEPGASAQFTVTVDPAASQGIGENQGFIVMDGPTHDAHMPVWARVIPATPLADVLIIDNSASGIFGTDYLSVYTSTLEALGKSYAVVDTMDSFGEATTIPEPAQLAGYEAVLWFTGDNFISNGAPYGIPGLLGLTNQDQFNLLDYLNNGGTLIAMGQDVASTVSAATTDPNASYVWIYNWGLASYWLQDSISNNGVPSAFVTTVPGVRPVFPNLAIKLNQRYVDEIRPSVDDYGRGGVPVLQYGGPFNRQNGYVAMAHRDQPSLEFPDLSYNGRAFYATFGLEGMDVVTVTGATMSASPVQLLGAVMNWTEAEAGEATISDITPVTTTAMTLFRADYVPNEPVDTLAAAAATAIAWRWDFGDGSPYVTSSTPVAGHTYWCWFDNTYTVRVEITDSTGNRTVASQEMDVSNSCFQEPQNTAVLNGLTIMTGTLTPTFDSAITTTTAYTAQLASDAMTLTVQPVVTGTGLSLYVNGMPAASGGSVDVPLPEGEHTTVMIDIVGDFSILNTYTIFVNRAPDAKDSMWSTTRGMPVMLDVVSGTVDLDGDVVTVQAVTPLTTTNGTVTMTEQAGTVVYTPTADFVGTSSFNFTVADGYGGTDEATATVDVVVADTNLYLPVIKQQQ